jgi:hypothetical protein
LLAVLFPTLLLFPAADTWTHLYPDAAQRTQARLACPNNDVECALRQRYAKDSRAANLAVDLWKQWQHVAGVEEDWQMDGGFRGSIRIVGELPVGPARQHLGYVHNAMADHDAFLSTVLKACPHVRYRWRQLAFHFFRSVKRQTPSAYASQWTIGYNLQGSLNTSSARVGETLFHELFHLNDQDHGEWARTALGPLHASLKARCGDNVACLKPYSPSSTRVKGGNWYAFHAENGPGEYAAELALRYYREGRQALHGEIVTHRFKCENAENASAWKQLVDEFFCGRDVVPTCP